nr:MAG TPA: hypothetical protein [Caudoviricetes sp.]
MTTQAAPPHSIHSPSYTRYPHPRMVTPVSSATLQIFHDFLNCYLSPNGGGRLEKRYVHL